ncbi:MAG: hypothetical protein GY851_00580, partial [bacterium]|nr:hypothetical protein [bacterium]
MRRFVSILGLAALCAGCVTVPELPTMLPLTVNGWAAEQPDEVYDPDGLYDYINGAAEIY